jgi:alginate O-acetyltransferase complex protein AlgI
MAIATAGLLGYRLTANFDFPYLARSIRVFWRRWHISLSSWFRDYLYIPLGGNRGNALHTARNLVCVFVLCGLWHGAAWTFVAWGLLHGALLIVERGGFGSWLARRNAMFQVAYVQLAVVIAWVLFRSPDLSSALTYWTRMASFGQPGARSLDPGWALLLAGLGALHVLVYVGRQRVRIDSWPPWAFGLAYGGALALALPWIATRHQPFIYFQF